MTPSPATRPPVQALAARLWDEERLLRQAVAAARDLNAALRRGDRAALAVALASHEDLAGRLAEASAARAAAAGNFSGSLSGLIAGLPEADAAELRAVQTALSAAAAELAALQRRNANLASHLRSYFRAVLDALAPAAGPVRYGPAGTRLAPAGGPALRARG